MDDDEQPPECDHFWHSLIGIPSRVIECDWCILCSITRPGYKDPREKWSYQGGEQIESQGDGMGDDHSAVAD